MMATLARSNAVSCRAQQQQQAAKPAAATAGRRALVFGGLAAVLAAAAAPRAAQAALEEDLLARSQVNKGLNDKKRLATSYANLARTRTVADGTCQFPSNMFGCESAAKGLNNGGVKFLKEDRELECEGKEGGKCASRPTFQ